METDAWPEWRCTVDIHKTMQAFADTWLCGSGPGAFLSGLVGHETYEHVDGLG
jgi:hypothetical protein